METYEYMNKYSYVKRRRIRMIDLIIIGAGQAGLTMGYYLKQEGYNFYYLRQENKLVIHGEIDMILCAFTPGSYSSLPGMALIGEKMNFHIKMKLQLI